MMKYKVNDSFRGAIVECFQALLVGTAGAAFMLLLVCIVQVLVQGEVTLFSNNFWLKEELKP